MIINPQIADLEPHNITTVDPDLSVVEYEARSEAHNFVGRTNTGAVVPGSCRADDRNVTVSSDSSQVAGAAQATDPAGSRVVPPTAAALISEGTEGTKGTEKPVTDDDIKVATRRQAAVRAFRDLTADVKDQVTGEIITKGMSNRTAARKVGYPFQTIYVWIRAFDADGFDGLLPKHRNSGRKPTLKFTRQETADVKALVLQTNRTKRAGSTPEALRTAIKRELLAPETAAIIRARFQVGQTPLPPAMRNQVRVPWSTTEAARGPRNAWLHNVESPGSLHLTVDEETGIEREIEGCERMTMDDGTINMVCNVPFNLPGNTCSENFGVMVGRFQLLLPVEHRYLFIPGFNYTARPRSSYRAEDLTATLQIVFTEHGYGEDPDIGREAASRNAQALRRSVVAIRSDGSAGVQKHEARDGMGAGEVVTNDPRLVPPAPAIRTLRQRAAGVGEDEFRRQAEALARDEEGAARLAAERNKYE